jgi:hypothetical protein
VIFKDFHAAIFFINCKTLGGDYFGLAQTKRFTRQPLASIVSNSKQHLLPLQSIYVSNS